MQTAAKSRRRNVIRKGPGGVGPRGRRRLRRNAKSDAAAYAEFHGRSPREVLEFQEPLLKSGDYFTLGTMYGLWLGPVKGDPAGWRAPEIEFEAADKVLAVADAHKGGGRDRSSDSD